MPNRPSKESAGTGYFRRVPVKQIASAAHAHGIDAVAIKCRESRRSISDLREGIGLPDGNRYAVVVAAGLDDALLVERVQ